MLLSNLYTIETPSNSHIIEQIKKLGDSCDWDYFTFTMDDIPHKAVYKFFVDMYNEVFHSPPAADELEALVPKDIWPLPSYAEMMFMM